jgi:predicted PurR-regulated permease PerM
MFTIISLVFFMLFDSQKVIDSVGNIFPKRHQKLYHNLSTNLFDIVARYFGGVIITAAFAGVFAYLPLAIMGIPYALALAVIVAIFDVIPYIGATIAGFIVVMFILLTGNVPAAIFMALYFLVYQQIENNVVTPLVQKSTVKLSALAVLVALMIGGAVGGIIGTLLAIPAAAFIKATYSILKQEGYIKSE